MGFMSFHPILCIRNNLRLNSAWPKSMLELFCKSFFKKNLYEITQFLSSQSLAILKNTLVFYSLG